MATSKPAVEASRKNLSIKVFGVGNAGVMVLEQVIGGALPGTTFIAVNTDAPSLAASSAPDKVEIEADLLREEDAARLKSLCEGADVVFIVAGLGGGAGTGISPVVARVAKEAGALALGFVTTPFACEGGRRQRLAEEGLEELKVAADGVICLANLKVCKLGDDNTSVVETFKLSNELLAEGVRGVWRLLMHTGLIEIHFGDLCAVIRDRHTESSFATAEAMGPARSREVMDKLLAHPMLDGGQMLGEAEAVLVSLMGGPDLTMAEVNRVMEQINSQTDHAQVIMGAAIDEAWRERLAVTLIASRKDPERPQEQTRRQGGQEDLNSQLLNRATTSRPGSRFVPPPPSLPPEQVEQLLARQASGGNSSKPNCRWRSSPKAASTRASQRSTKAKTWMCRPTSGGEWR